MKQIAAVELERCVALANLLDIVPADDFDLRAWVRQLPKNRQTHLFGLVETHPGCGFAGCAMGWAAYAEIIPGLELHGGNIVYREARKKPLANWDAVKAAMGIQSLRFAEYLFYPDGYNIKPTPRMVADRLRRFVRKIEAIRARDRRKVAAPVQRKLELVA